MASRSAQAILIGWLLLGLGACASTRLSTRDIYAELAFSIGLVCTPNAVARQEQRQDERPGERLRALGPWLIAEIGRDEIRRMQQESDEEAGTYDPTFVCPTDEQHMRRRMRRMMLLHELENRARASPIGPTAGEPATDGIR